MPSSVMRLIRVVRCCGTRAKASVRSSSSRICSVEAWTVSPRKSRKKSGCFSSTTTSTPARASSSPSIAPAGPQPAMTQVVESGRVRSWAATVASGGSGARSRPRAPRVGGAHITSSGFLPGGSDQAQGTALPHRVLPAPDAELAVEDLGVALDRVDRQVQSVPDLALGGVAAQRAQDRLLAVGQLLDEGSRTARVPDRRAPRAVLDGLQPADGERSHRLVVDDVPGLREGWAGRPPGVTGGVPPREGG